MHKMQPSDTDVHGVCLSVSQSVIWLNSDSLCKNGWTDQDAIWGEHSWGPMEHCVLHGYPDPPTDRGGNLLLNFGTPSYLQTAQARGS